jgi:hypothetical protein
LKNCEQAAGGGAVSQNCWDHAGVEDSCGNIAIHGNDDFHAARPFETLCSISFKIDSPQLTTTNQPKTSSMEVVGLLLQIASVQPLKVTNSLATLV